MSLSTQVYHPEEIRMPKVTPTLNLTWKLVRLRIVQFMTSKKVSTAETDYLKQEIYSSLDINLLLVQLQVKNTQPNFTILILESWQSSDLSLGVSNLTRNNLKVIFWLTVPWGGLIMSWYFVWAIPKTRWI